MSDSARHDTAPPPRRRIPGPPPPREPWVARFGWIIIFVVLVFLAGLVAGLFGARISGGDVAGLPGAREPARTGARVEISGLGSRVVALEDRAGELSAQVARLRVADNASLVARTDAIEAAVRRLEQNSRGLPALSQRLAAAEGAVARVDALETRMAAAEGVRATVSRLAVRLAAIEAAAQRLPEMAARVERAEGAANRVPELVVRLEQLEKAAPGTARLAARLNTLEGAVSAARTVDAGGARPSPAPAYELLERLSKLDVRLDALEDGGQTDSLFAALRVIAERLGVLERGFGGSASAEDVAVITARVDDLESGIAGTARAAEVEAIGARIDPLERALAGTARAADIADFEQRVAALEKDPVSARRTAALVIAVGQLRGALSSGRPYAPELEGLKAIAAPLADGRLDSAIVALEARALAGVSTLDDLRQRFSSLAARLVRADALGPDPGWVDKTLDRLSSVVSVRRIGDIEGTSVEAKVARAEARLAEGNLEGAVASLTDLKGAVSLALEVWLGDARARLAADRALAEMNERTAAHLQAS